MTSVGLITAIDGALFAPLAVCLWVGRGRFTAFLSLSLSLFYRASIERYLRVLERVFALLEPPITVVVFFYRESPFRNDRKPGHGLLPSFFVCFFFFTEFLLGGLEEAHDGGFQRWFDGSRRC